MSMNEYVTTFTQLSRYAPHEVDTDEKKQECFLNGLNDGLAYALEARDFENFQGIVNKALVLENCRGVMENKHKLVHQHQSSSRLASDEITTRGYRVLTFAKCTTIMIAVFAVTSSMGFSFD
jgi:hypothetical protein